MSFCSQSDDKGTVPDLTNDIMGVVAKPSEDLGEVGESSRRRKKRGIYVIDFSSCWYMGIVPYVFSDTLGT